MKKILWIGIILLVIGFIAGFLSGATSNGQPLVAFLYGTNQVMWMAIAVLGAIMTLTGIIGLIVRAMRKPKQQPPQMPQMPQMPPRMMQ